MNVVCSVLSVVCMPQLNLGEIFSPLKGLRYRFNFGPDFRSYRNGSFADANSVSREGTNRASLTNQSDFSWTLDNLIYYDKEIGKHSLGVMLYCKVPLNIVMKNPLWLL